MCPINYWKNKCLYGMLLNVNPTESHCLLVIVHAYVILLSSPQAILTKNPIKENSELWECLDPITYIAMNPVTAYILEKLAVVNESQISVLAVCSIYMYFYVKFLMR